jgi:hypothetical protein
MRLHLPILFALTAPLLAQQAPVDVQQLQQDLNREAGVSLAFREPRPPLAKLTFKAIETTEAQGHKLIRYSVGIGGPVARGPYILMLWDIHTNTPVKEFQQLQIDDKGTLRCAQKTKDCPGGGPGDELVIGFTGMIAQPRRLVLTGMDKKPIAMGEVVPFPASGTDQGCTIDAVLLRPNASAVLIIGRGFQPGETVKFESSSYDESVNSNKTADESGEAVTVVLPFVKGHDEGKTSIAMSNSKCRPSTTFNWGAYREE